MCFFCCLLRVSVFFLCFQRVTDFEYKKILWLPFFLLFSTAASGALQLMTVGSQEWEIVGLRLLYTEDIMFMLCLYVFSSLGVISIAQQSFFLLFFVHSFRPPSLLLVLLLYLFRRLTITALACNVAKRVEWVEK